MLLDRFQIQSCKQERHLLISARAVMYTRKLYWHSCVHQESGKSHTSQQQLCCDGNGLLPSNQFVWGKSLFCSMVSIVAFCQDRSTGILSEQILSEQILSRIDKPWGVPVISLSPGPTAWSKTTACPAVCNQIMRGSICDGEGRWVDLTWLGYF